MLDGEKCPMWRKNRTGMREKGVPDLCVKPHEYMTAPWTVRHSGFWASQAFIATGYMILSLNVHDGCIS